MASPIPRFPPVTRTDRLTALAPPRLSTASWRAYRSPAWDRLPVVDQSTQTRSGGPDRSRVRRPAAARAGRRRAAAGGRPRRAARRLPRRADARAADPALRRSPGDPAGRRRSRPGRPGGGGRHLGVRRGRGPDPGGGRATPRERAVDVARVAAPIAAERIELADEPGHGEVTWVSSYVTDPFEVSVSDKIALLGQWSEGLLGHDGIDHVDAVAARGQGVQVLLRRRDHRRPAAGPAEPGGHRGRGEPGRPVRDHAHAGAAGRPRL